MFANIFNAKIIDSQTEHDGAPFVNPKAGGGGSFIVSFVIQPLAEEVISKFTGLGQSIGTFADAKVCPTITCIGGEVVFSYELIGDVLEVNVGIIGMIEGCAQVKVLDVKAHKACIFVGQDAINEGFEEIQ